MMVASDGGNPYRLSSTGQRLGLCMTRQLDLVELLHLLGHELRSPAGVLIGYLRMLQEGRVSTEADRLRMYENMRGPVGRITTLGESVSQLTRWLEPHERTAVRTDVRELLDRSIADANRAIDRPVDARIAVRPGQASIAALDRDALEAALTAVIHATARETSDSPVMVRAWVRRDSEPVVEVVVGPPSRVDVDAAGSPAGEISEEFAITRGGMGLSLVVAIAVLDAHAARVWTVAGTRSVAGVRLPVVAGEQDQ
jgi:signal transduction histidine kinase